MISPLFRQSLFVPGDRVLVAVSGGPDSLSLLHALLALRAELGLAALEAAHLDHGLRGDESAGEAAWVAEWCASHGVACHVGKADVAALAQQKKVSKQQAARDARYAFLGRVAAESGATKIATGHTQNDQVETILLHILRGTGLDGLRGIPARRGLIVRPLLQVSRAEIEAYCAQHNLTPRRDPSNLSADAYTRNRIRLELLPQLARDYNPSVGAALLRLSEIAARDSDYLHAQAEAALADVTREEDIFRLTLDRSALMGLHPALLRYVLRRAIAGMRGAGEGISQAHIEQVCRALTMSAAHVFALTLPSYPLCRVRLGKETLTVTVTIGSSSIADVSVLLPVPGEAALTEIGWRLRADIGSHPRGITLDADAVDAATLTVRNWRIGDKIAPLGMGGHTKKVSDIFTDAKVPRAERSRVPIVADNGGILWIVGHAVAERAKVTPATCHHLFLTATKFGDAEAGKPRDAAE